MRSFYRFLELEPVLCSGDALYAVVVTGAFCDCMFRIVARQGQDGTAVELDALDVTPLPEVGRQGEFEYLNRLVQESRALHEIASAPVDALEKLRALPQDEPVVLDLRELRGPLEVVDAALAWSDGCPGARVVVPRRWAQELGAKVPAGRGFRSGDEAVGAC